ncbi:restriction endonuclease subunit S [Myxococcota bacterium]|nr:restriction endonuclease subunit S [Myxococcota bacterium]
MSANLVPLGRVVRSMRNGLSPSRRGEVLGEVLTLSAVTQGAFDPAHRKPATFDKEPSDDQLARPGMFLMCRGNGNLNLVGSGVVVPQNAEPVVYPDTVIGAVLDPGKVDVGYLAHAWTTAAVRAQIESGARTTNGTHKVNQQVLEAIKVPLPPLPEQRRIAAILDEADALRRTRREALGLLDELLRSTFLEMFGDPVTNPRGWPVVQAVTTFSTPPRIGTTRPAHDEGDVRVVRVGEVGGAQVALERCGKVSLPAREADRYRCKPGDFLLARAIGSEHLLGKGSLMQDVDETVVFDSHVMRLRFDRRVMEPVFFQEWMLTEGGRRRFLKRAGRTAVQFNVNAEQIGAVQIPLPPIPLQNAFSRLAGEVAMARGRQASGVQQADEFFASLLHRAFLGEL